MDQREGVLQNIPWHCVKMYHCYWFNKELNGHQVGRKSLGRASGDREAKSQSQREQDIQEER